MQEEEQEEVLDAVIVVRTVGEDGSISCRAIPQGNVQATEVQTILELGVLEWRQRIGL